VHRDSVGISNRVSGRRGETNLRHPERACFHQRAEGSCAHLLRCGYALPGPDLSFRRTRPSQQSQPRLTTPRASTVARSQSPTPS